MLRTHTCSELRISNIGEHVTLTGWVHHVRDKGGVLWIDLRDGFGMTQLFFEEGKTNSDTLKTARKIGREFVIKVVGTVIERQAKNNKIETGDIEIKVNVLNIISSSKTPPFTIEDKTDGGEDLRMKYRYLDLRRKCLQKNLQLRHLVAQQTRLFLNKKGFIDIETPMLIRSTPEGARDFVVPSRMNLGDFYALPQSPQTFKQLLMVSGVDRYYQIVRCFRDEDLRSDRQPEFTQLDCEMAFVEQDDVLALFEEFIIYLFQKIKGVSIPPLSQMNYEEAIQRYGSDKPDIRFDMPLITLGEIVKGTDFVPFNNAEVVVGICAKQCSSYTRKQIDSLSEFVKKQQIGINSPLIYVRYNTDGSFKSSVDKFYNQSTLKKWAEKMHAEPGDLILVMAGKKNSIYYAMGELRLHLGSLLNLRDPTHYAALWVINFPLLEWNNQTNRFHAKHHPFTAPKHQDIHLLDEHPDKVRANAYDLVINGIEIGGGSIRIHDYAMQQVMFKKLGFTHEEAENQFGFLMEAFQYGAPPHGGIAFGFDRLCALFSGSLSIRDVIAFPKNNAGKDVMAKSPSSLSQKQADELGLVLDNAM